VLIGTTLDGGAPGERQAVVPLTFQWLKQVQHAVLNRYDASWLFQEDDLQIQDYMRYHFGDDPSEVISGATYSAAGKTLPDAALFASFPFERIFEGVDAWLVLRGFKPHSSEDKWFIHVDWEGPESGQITFRRSWTGYLAWQVPFWIASSGVQVDTARVNVNPRQYKFSSKDREIARLDAVIRRLLLGTKPAR
jgi:hypothetical protein